MQQLIFPTSVCSTVKSWTPPGQSSITQLEALGEQHLRNAQRSSMPTWEIQTGRKLSTWVGFDLSLNPGYLKKFPSHNNNKEVSTGCYGAGRNFSILCCFDRVLSSGFTSVD